jgi:hypothetical protein
MIMIDQLESVLVGVLSFLKPKEDLTKSVEKLFYNVVACPSVSPKGWIEG